MQKFERLVSQKWNLLILSLLGVGITGVAVIGWLYLFNKEVLGWRGITPGQTTEQEVLNILGQPDHIVRCETWGRGLDHTDSPVPGYIIRPCLFAPLIYEYEQKRAPDKAPGVHQIHFREDKVWLVIEDMAAYPFDEVITNEEIIARYGWPRAEAWTKAPKVRHLLYCEQGTIIAINDIQALWFFYFKPISGPECAHEFEFYLTPNSPQPIIN